MPEIESSSLPEMAGGVTTAAGSTSVIDMRHALEQLVRLMERTLPGVRASVLLLDEDGVTLRHAAVGSLPEDYCKLIDGEAIGPAAGSCGTAAYRGEQVIVGEIATDPLWAEYRQVAEPFGLAACWSTPILNPEGRVLGTFAMYHDEPREPTPSDLELTETAAVLSATIIMRSRAATELRAHEEELRSSQSQLRATLEASSTSTWRWDMRTNRVDGDDSFFRLFDVEPTESRPAERFLSVIHPEDRDRVTAAAERCAAEGVDMDEEFRIVRPDGSLRWVVDKGKVIRGADGKPRDLIGACVDVTERRVGDRQFRALAESIPQLAWMADAEGRLTWYNRQWYEYTGTTLEEVEGWGWRRVHHPDHVDRVERGIQHAWDTGEPWEDAFPLRGRDGRYRWFLSRAQPIRDADGEVVRWFGTNTDITELHEAELARDRALAEAKAERERLYEIFMQAPAAITVLEGPEHVVAIANPLYIEMVGGRELIGRTVAEALPEAREQGFVDLLDRVYTSGEPYSARERLVRLQHTDDRPPEDIYLDFTYQPLKDSRDATFGVLALAVDVTEKVRAREQIAEARSEAERANQAKSDFLAAMSHDLRTPLNAIGGYADLVDTGVYGQVSDAQRDAMRRIRQAGNHLLTLITDILSFAKVEAGRLPLDVTDIPLDEILGVARAMVELQAADKGLRLTTPDAQSDVRLRADRERTVQILNNLLTNAVKFTESGSVTVASSTDDSDVRIMVSDTGRGIPSERLESIFEPFIQAGRSEEEKQQGVGLGLAISREMAHAMGGDLTVESTPARGSTFTVTLPRAPA